MQDQKKAGTKPGRFDVPGASPDQIAVSRLLSSVGIPVLSYEMTLKERSIALWIGRGRIPDGAVTFIRENWPKHYARSGYRHPEHIKRLAWRSLPGAEYAAEAPKRVAARKRCWPRG